MLKLPSDYARVVARRFLFRDGSEQLTAGQLQREAAMEVSALVINDIQMFLAKAHKDNLTLQQVSEEIQKKSGIISYIKP